MLLSFLGVFALSSTLYSRHLSGTISQGAKGDSVEEARWQDNWLSSHSGTQGSSNQQKRKFSISPSLSGVSLVASTPMVGVTAASSHGDTMVSPTVSPSLTPMTPTVSPTMTPSPTPSKSSVTTMSPSPSQVIQANSTVSPFQTVSPSNSPSLSTAASVSPTMSPSATPSPSVTLTPALTPTYDDGGSVIISEIGWMGTTISATDEWIELYNGSSSQVSLEGWILKSNDGSPNISLTGTISAKGFYLIERTNDDTIPEVSANLVTSFGQGGLNNGGETLILLNSEGQEVDKVLGTGGWLAGDNTSKSSMERTTPTASGAEASSWRTCPTSRTPGVKNSSW